MIRADFKQSISDWAPLIKIINLSLSGFAGLLAINFYLDLDFDTWLGLALMCSIFSVYVFNCFTDRAEDLAGNETDLATTYYKLEQGGRLTSGTPEDHNFADVAPIYPDALFVFERI